MSQNVQRKLLRNQIIEPEYKYEIKNNCIYENGTVQTKRDLLIRLEERTRTIGILRNYTTELKNKVLKRDG